MSSDIALEPKQITSQIYQGGWLRPQDIPELVQLGITHVLNLDLPYTTDPLPFVEANITVHNAYIRDHCLMLPQLVREVIEVIDRSLSSPGNKIYIHCVEGVSRSPTITWFYLIYTGLSPEEAAAKVKPNPVLYNATVVQQVIANRPVTHCLRQ
ncbi:MAG: dual specificity protein phosphatase family protein [Deltaproteobacteria bacterium]|nr:MAG: dual specificity protein phosphatase family protein [Deltaproteobacteria bacterium]